MTKHKKGMCVVRTKSQQYQHEKYLERKGRKVKKEKESTTKRICLKHGGLFSSMSLHNRICDHCKGKIQAVYSGKKLTIIIDSETEDSMSPKNTPTNSYNPNDQY